jgi:hypothetical protein
LWINLCIETDIAEPADITRVDVNLGVEVTAGTEPTIWALGITSDCEVDGDCETSTMTTMMMATVMAMIQVTLA